MTAAIRRSCGIALIAVGVVAIPIPFIPGVPLIVAGAAVLGNDRTWLENRGILTQEKEQE